MIRNLFLLSLSVFLRASILSAQNSTPSHPLEKPSLTTVDYSYFLSQIAASDLTQLYDLKMGEDSSSASLIRKGQPGEYSYSTLAGKDQNPISYLSRRDYQAYQQSQESNSCDQGESFNESQVDDELKSNQVHFSSCSLILEEQGIGDGESGGSFSFNDALKTALTVGAIYLAGRALNHYTEQVKEGIKLQNDERFKSKENDSYTFIKDKIERDLLRAEKIKDKTISRDMTAVLKCKFYYNEKAHLLSLTKLNNLYIKLNGNVSSSDESEFKKYRSIATEYNDSLEKIFHLEEGIVRYNPNDKDIGSPEKATDHLQSIYRRLYWQSTGS